MLPAISVPDFILQEEDLVTLLFDQLLLLGTRHSPLQVCMGMCGCVYVCVYLYMYLKMHTYARI